jgi:hypothetical protein
MLDKTTKLHVCAHTRHVVVCKLKSLPFCDVAHTGLVLSYRRFGTTYRSDMSRNVGKNYQLLSHQHCKERRSQLHCRGSLKCHEVN